MHNELYVKLLDLIKKNPLINSDELSNKLGISKRQVQSLMTQLIKYADDCDVLLYAKKGPGGGYVLETAEKNYRKLIETIQGDYSSFNSYEDRKGYILYRLLTAEKAISYDALAEELYLSDRMIRTYISQIRDILSVYYLELGKQSGTGIYVTGAEKAKRDCLVKEVLTNRNNQLIPDLDLIKKEYGSVRTIIKNALIVTGYRVYDGAIDDIAMKLLVACIRMRYGHYINRKSGVQQYNEKVKSVANTISSELEIKYGIKMDKDEYDHVYIQLISKGLFGENDIQQIPENLFLLISDCLKAIDMQFGTKFYTDINLAVSLCLHMVPLLYRMKYNSLSSNPLIEDIKKKYIYEMEISRTFVTIVFSHMSEYDIRIDNENFNYDFMRWNYYRMVDDELGYFALDFRLSLSERSGVKKNVLLVCASGRRIVELFKQSIDDLYGKYINKLEVCSSLELEQVDLDNYDVIFTTVSLDQSLYPIPVFFINSVFNDDSRILKELEKDSQQYDFFDERFFLRDIEASDKEEVIKVMVTHMRRYMDLREDFLDLVLQREKEAPTSFGNLVAFPHPTVLCGKKSFICIGTLKKKIDWGKHKVQLVMLLSAAEEHPQELPSLYELVVKIANEEENVALLMKEPYIETIRKIMETE